MEPFPPTGSRAANSQITRNEPQINKKRGIVTIVEFSNDTQSIREEVEHVVQTLLANGVPSDVLSEVEGRGDENEEVEPLINELELRIRDAVAEWEHSHLLDEALNLTTSDIINMTI